MRTVSPLLPAARAVPAAFGLDEDASDETTLLLSIGSYVLLEGDESHALDAVFAAGEEAAERRLEATLASAFASQNAGELARAAESYWRAEAQLRGDIGPRRVLVLVSLAALEREQGRLAESAALLDRALALAPNHLAALEARAAIARERGESSLAATLLERLAPQLPTSARRVEVLRVVADESLRAARAAISVASELTPGSVLLLERLRAVDEAAGLWDSAVTAAVQAAELAGDPRQRARALVDAARLCSAHTTNTARAVALFEAAIEDDPEVPGAFEAIEAELERAGDAAGLAAAYTRQLERLSGKHAAAPAQRELLRRLARVQRDRLDQPLAAIESFDRLVQLDPVDLEARLELSALLEQTGEVTLAARALEAASTFAPTQPEVYRSLVRLFTREGDHDRVYAACSALVALGEADLDEQLTFVQHRPEALPSARAGLDEDGWSQLLPLDHPVALDELAAAIEPAVLDAYFSRVSLPAPPPGRARLDPGSTTVSAARCFAWAARLLGVDVPEIYAQPEEARIGVRTLPTRAVAVELGRPLLSGRSVGELAFIAAHHLTYSRPGLRLVRFAGAVDAVRGLLMAGISVVRSDLPAFAAHGAEVHPLAPRMAEHLSAGARQRIGTAVEAVLASGGTLDVLLWLRSVEEMACRAGLLASGDLSVASGALTLAEAPPAKVSAADRARALLPFCISQRHSALRHWLGTAVS